MKYGVCYSPSILQIQIIVTILVAGGLAGTNTRNSMTQVALYLSTESNFTPRRDKYVQWVILIDISLSSSNMLVGPFNFGALTSYHQTKHTVAHKFWKQLKDICTYRGLLPPTLCASISHKIKKIKPKSTDNRKSP